MTISGDGARGFALLRGKASGNADTVSVVHDGGTLSSVAAWYREIERRPEEDQGPRAPNTVRERVWTFLASALAAATLHEGVTSITDSAGNSWRTSRIRPKGSLGLISMDTWRAADYQEA